MLFGKFTKTFYTRCAPQKFFCEWGLFPVIIKVFPNFPIRNNIRGIITIAMTVLNIIHEFILFVFENMMNSSCFQINFFIQSTQLPCPKKTYS